MKRINRISALLIAIAFLLSCNSALAQELGGGAAEKTVITGIEDEISALYSNELSRTISITPCDGTRSVELSLYDSSSKAYKLVEKYTTSDEHTSKLKISFPKSKRKKTRGIWKITVLASDTAQKAEKRVNITSENIATKDLSSKAVCIYCVEDKRVIYEKNMHKRLKQASTTKIMTATLLVESKKLSKTKKISKKAANTPYSTPKMIAGDRYTNKALLHAIMLPSSNGAAVAIAESVSGSTGKFVKKMNKKAKSLGMKDTHYVTPHGLDARNHYSSAYDNALLMSYVYPKSKTFRNVIAKKSYTVKSKKAKPVKIYTKDELKGYSSKHKGGKTGHTSKAGYCFCGVYKHGGKTYVVSILGSKTNGTRWSDMKKLYSYIDKYATTKY